VECPQCRSVVTVAGNDPSSLPTVFFINGLIEGYEILKKAESNEIACQSCSSDAKATSFCHTCSMFICVTCTNAHETMKAFSGHETAPISEMKTGTLIRLPTKKPPISTCKKHEGELQRLFCFKCKMLICQFCALVDHAGHKFDFVKAVADAFKEEILSNLVPLHETHAMFMTAIAKVEDSKKEIGDQGEDVALTIARSFEELHVILNNREQALLQQAREVVGRKVDALDRQQEEIQLAVATLNSLMGFIERTVENASDEEFISMKQQMNSRIKQLFRRYQDVKLSPNEVADAFIAVPPPTSLSELCKKTFIADGPGLKSATVNQVSKFTVNIHNTHNCSQQNVSAELKSLVDGSLLQATVVSQTPSLYKLSYTPTARGRYQLTVRVNDTEIGNFEVFVQHPPTQLGTPVRTIPGVKPLYIAVGDKGELFVTEHWDGQYTVLSAQGQRLLNVGSKGKPPFGDGWPTGIAADGKSNVYVASGHKVQKFNRYGQLVKFVGKKGVNTGEFHWSRGVKYHNHQVYVCDKDNGRIQVFDSNLNFVRSFGTQGDGPGQLKKPRDIDFDAQGKIYVVDPSKNQVLVFSENGRYLQQFDARGQQGESELNSPTGLCVSGDYVYITEWANHCVSVFRTSGEFVHSFGKEGSGRDELLDPSGIAVDKDGFVFVCDTSNSRVQVF